MDSLGSPGTQILIEARSIKEHVVRALDIGNIPQVQGLVEGKSTSKHVIHVLDVGNIPSIQGLVEGESITNVHDMSATLETSHEFKGWLKIGARKNM